jgi:flagellar export protein FliJ
MSRRQPIDSIIRAREIREERLLAELGRLQRAVNEAERRLEEGIAALRRQDRTEVPREIRSAWLGLAREYRRRLEREVHEARRGLEERLQEAERVRKAAVEAAQERRAAEQIAERRAALLEGTRRRQECSELDEVGKRTADGAAAR